MFAKNKNYTFNPGKQDYKNKTDKRIQQRMAEGHRPNHYDVLKFNLCKNVSNTKQQNGINQLPDALVDFLIYSYTNTDDNVLDPFVGTRTVTRRANHLKRNAIGIDINEY